MIVTIYHNPLCSKLRATLELLQARGLEPDIVEYLKTPPSAAELKSILKMLDSSRRASCARASRAMRSLA
jgi:arsenate reductase